MKPFKYVIPTIPLISSPAAILNIHRCQYRSLMKHLSQNDHLQLLMAIEALELYTYACHSEGREINSTRDKL